MVKLYTLPEIGAAGIGEVGGKAWHLGKAAMRGLPVPNSLVIPYDTAERCLADDAVKEQIFARITDYFKRNRIKLAVRSSSNAEDLLVASGAGIFESVIGIEGRERLIDAVGCCMKALCTPTAQRYADKMRDDRQGTLQMNIMIQELVTARRSGVTITNRPQPKRFMAEGTWGLALDLVSGMINPDFIVGEMNTGEVLIERKGGQQTVCLPSDDGSGVVRRKIHDEEANRPVFSPELVAELSSLIRQINESFATDQEIEWAEDEEGKLWLIQTRPFVSGQAYR